MIKYKKQRSQIKSEANITFANVAGWVEKGSVEAQRVFDWLHEQAKDLKKTMEEELRADGILLEFKTEHNIITTAGMNVLVNLLTGDTTDSGEVNYGAVGIGTPSIALGNTALTSEQFRTTPSSQSASGAMAYIDFVFGASDFDTTVIGQITEFGNFIDGTASADSGKLFSDIATGGWDKNSTTSLFVSCEYTLANA